VLRYLLQKTASPGDYVGMASQLYRPTKDFRVLECVADGVPGHSPEAVYRYLEMAGQVVAEIHEEATCDAVTARIAAMLPKAATDVDRRALRLLLVMMESRAGMVPKTDPAHGPRALAALRAAFDGALVPGERVLLARRLAALDPAKVPGLPEEQMARLEVLRAGSTEGVLERLALDRAVADVLWRRGQRDAAVERLEAALGAVRAESEGTLPPEASGDYDALIGWWTELGRFRVAETRLRDDLAHETRSQRRDRLRMRLFALYAQAIRRGGATALGSGAELLEVAATEMETFLAEGPAYLMNETARHHGELHEGAVQSKAVRSAGERYLTFARDRLPKILPRNPLETDEVLQDVLPRLARLAGALPALTVALDQVDREPTWFARLNMDVWSRMAGWLAQWRRDAGALGPVEGRLLPLVLKKLEAELTAMGGQGNGFWYHGASTYWAEHARDFAGVAEKVAEVNAARPAVVLYVARYQRTGLELAREAVSTLQMAVANGRDPEDLRVQLAEWLREDRRFAEALPIVERLVKERPESAPYRVLGCAVLHGLGRDADAEKLLTDAVALWKAKKTWHAQVAAVVGSAALEAELARPAATWLEDALRMRREAGGGAGPDGTLSQ